jgi:hypothetical protein
MTWDRLAREAQVAVEEGVLRALSPTPTREDVVKFLGFTADFSSPESRANREEVLALVERFGTARLARAALAMLAPEPMEAHADCATMDDVFRAVACRALGPEYHANPDALRARWEEFRAKGWMWWGRALGAFIATVVAERTSGPDRWREGDAIYYIGMSEVNDSCGHYAVAARYRRAAQRAKGITPTEDGR